MVSNYKEYINQIRFRFIQPDQWLPKGFGRLSRLISKIGFPVELANTQLPEKDRNIELLLKELCQIPKMSTFAIGAMINRAVKQMPDDQIFVNVGVWNGFTFLSGIAGNADKRCIGVDNFCEFVGARESFLKRFNRYKSNIHQFCEQDYREYFTRTHKEPIGFYIYDGQHSYKNQKLGLELAEPFLAKGCIIMIDDTNDREPYDATMDFIRKRPGQYEIILDRKTRRIGHPTYWNGILVFVKK